ncbi:MAG: TPM domain-containing protein, partial [Acidobacteria bacterium]|nr:TPM domain-containing protein [Acidobacteriota bacterium]
MTRLRTRRVVLCALLLFSATLAPALAQVKLPAPDDRSVHDFARVLSPDAVQKMEARHTELFQKTGIAIIVVTVKSLEGEPIDDFAVRVGKEWGAGKKGQDRGIVVALSTGDRRVFIATGYGVEGFLPDGKVGGILDRYVIPALRQDDWSQGLEMASAALTAQAAREYNVTIEGLPNLPAGRGLPKPSPLGVFVALIFLAILIFVMIKNPTLFL